MKYDKEILEKTGIFVFNNAISDKLCENTIIDFNNNPQDHFNGKTGYGVDKNAKNTIDYRPKENIAQEYYKIIRDGLELVLKEREGLKKYDVFLTRPQFQYNKKQQGFFEWHDDSITKYSGKSRILASIFYLNDVEKGGETEFKYQKYSVKPEKGKLIMFPATWSYFHKGHIPMSNDKYIITNFIFRFY